MFLVLLRLFAIDPTLPRDSFVAHVQICVNLGAGVNLCQREVMCASVNS